MTLSVTHTHMHVHMVMKVTTRFNIEDKFLVNPKVVVRDSENNLAEF